MAQHSRRSHHDGPVHDDAPLADLLDLDAELFGSYLDEATEWARRYAAGVPLRVADVGAGTGAVSLALARRFTAAEVVAIDRSALMLERLRTSAREQGLTDRIRAVQADVDVAWPKVGALDVVWAASSMHEFADPDGVFRDVYAALNPGGLLVVIEMDALPRFLPYDVGQGTPGLESRCHQAMLRSNWNSYPDWQPYMERAGFEVVARRSFIVAADSTPEAIMRYARAQLRHIRSALEGQLAGDDPNTLDHLLADDGLVAVLRRGDQVVRGIRTAWAARRPGPA